MRMHLLNELVINIIKIKKSFAMESISQTISGLKNTFRKYSIKYFNVLEHDMLIMKLTVD